MENRIKLAFIATAISGLSACASGPMLQTESLTGIEHEPRGGIPYFLPKGWVPITISGTPGAPAPGAPGGEKTATDATTGSGAVYALKIAYGATQYFPDGTRQFFLAYTHNNWADDNTSITVDQNGLLQTASVQSTDQTPSVIEQVAQVAGQITQAIRSFGLVSEVFGKTTQPASPLKCNLLPYSFTNNIDPSEAAFELPAVGDGKNNDQYINFTGTSERIDNGTKPSVSDENKQIEALGKNGIIFRAPVVYKITIIGTPSHDANLACDLNAKTMTYTAYVSVPNGGKFFLEDTSRAPAVKKTISYTIQNGMLVGVNPVHPSEYNAYAAIPVSVLNTIIAIPSNLLTLHLQQLQAQDNISAAQATLLQNEMNVITNRAALQKAQASAAASPSP